MAKIIDYYLSLASPYTLMGAERVEAIARAAGATLVYKPIDLGRLFPLSGGLPGPKRAPQRQAYRLVEIKRWADFHKLPLNLHPKHFPVPTEVGCRLVLAAVEQGADAGDLSRRLMRAVWIEERDIADRATLSAICGEAGLEGGALLAHSETPMLFARYEAIQKEALEAQVFGAPTYAYQGELFWGQDRLDFLERAVARG